MTVEILHKLGGQPVVLEVSQLLLRDELGTPIAVACEYGPRGMVRVAHAKDDDFNKTLAALGYGGKVNVETIRIDPPPPSARRLIT